jgi:CRISPR-associated protein Csx17
VTEFVRFELRQTTSSQVFEAVPREHIQVNPLPDEEPDARLLLQAVEAGWLTHPLLVEPRDGKQRGKFKGIVGPIEAAILSVSEDPQAEERWQQLLRFLVQGQTRIDHNKNLRDRCRPLPWLSSDWFGRAWPDHLRALPPDVLLARAIASIGARSDYPLLLNVYGVEPVKGKSPIFSRNGRPQRAVWHSGDALEVLTCGIQRRLVDAEELAPVPLQGTQASDRSLIDYFLHADTSFFEAVVSWVPALALMNWAGRADHLGTGSTPPIPDGLSLLDMLFRPIFQPENLWVRGNLLFRNAASRPHAATARRLFHLIQYGQLDEAIQVARNRYLAAGHEIIAPRIGTLAGTDDCRRLAAGFLIPATREAVANDFEKWWLTPKKRSSEKRRSHANA